MFKAVIRWGLGAQAYVGSLSSGRALLLKGGGLCVCVCLLVGVLACCGVTDALQEGFVAWLGAFPFYLSSEEAAVCGPSLGVRVGLCLGLTGYLAFALLRERCAFCQYLIFILCVVALLLASLCGVFYGCVLNLMAPLLGLCLLFVGLRLGVCLSHFLAGRRGR